MSFFQEAGVLLFGTRLKRLSDRYLSDLSQIYKSEGYNFEPSWFPFFYLLDIHKKMTISEVAQQLEITQSGVSQMIALLEKKGFVRIEKSTKDKRVRSALLTQAGEDLLLQIKPVWDAIRKSMSEMAAEGDHSRYLLTAFDEIEVALASRNLFSRVQARLRKLEVLDTLNFAEYRSRHEAGFKELLLNWLSEGAILPGNFEWINDAARALEDNIAAIIVAENSGEVVAAAAASIDKDKGSAELHLVIEDEAKAEELSPVLLEHIIAALVKKNVREISTTVELQNTTTIKALKAKAFSLKRIEQTARSNRSCMVLTRTDHGG